MCLINNRQIPVTLGDCQRLPHALGAQEIATDDDAVKGIPWVLGGVGLEHRGLHLLEAQLDPLTELARPLRSQIRRRDDQDPVSNLAQLQLLHVKPRHDRLASAGIVGEEEPQPRFPQEVAVDTCS